MTQSIIKWIIAWLSIVLMSQSLLAQNDIDYEKKELMDQLILLQGARDLANMLADKALEQIKIEAEASGEILEEDVLNVFRPLIIQVFQDEVVFTPEFQELYYKTYDEIFDEDELREAIAFYKTRVGKKTVRSSKDLNDQFALLLTSKQEQLIASFYARLQNELSSLQADEVNTETSLVETIDKPPGFADSVAELSKQVCTEPTDNRGNRKVVYRGSPVFPRIALEHGIDGWVELGLVVEADGSVSGKWVSNSYPGTLFNSHAIKAAADYRYCEFDKQTREQIRIKFVVDKSPKQTEIRRGDKYQLLKSKKFKKDIKAYGQSEARKAFAIANDGGDQWVTYYRIRGRSQEDVTEQTLRYCESFKKEYGVKSKCQLVFEGHSLNPKLVGIKGFDVLAKKLSKKKYEERSHYQIMLEDYAGLTEPKALAFAENGTGDFYYAPASGGGTQQSTNKSALEACRMLLPDNFSGSCKLMKIGDYLENQIPRMALMRGVWEGKAETLTNGKNSEYDSLRFVNCNGIPRFEWFKRDEPESQVEFARILTVEERRGNVVLSSIEDGDTWTETQLWSLAQLNDSQATLQWARHVHNIELELDDPKKHFGFFRVGTLNKVEDECSEIKH